MDGVSGISCSFHAVSLVPVRLVKFDVSSLTDLVSERLHCLLVLCTCWHDGNFPCTLVTPRAINTLETVLLPRRQTFHSDSQLPQYENPHQTFHTVDEDNQAVDSFHGVVSALDYTVLNGVLQLRHAALVLRVVIDKTVLPDHTDNIVDVSQPYLVSLATNTHSVGSLVNLKHISGRAHLPDYLLKL